MENLGLEMQQEKIMKWELLEKEMFAPEFENDEQKEEFLVECFSGKRKFPWHLQGQSVGVTNAEASNAAIAAGGIPVIGGSLTGRPKYEEMAEEGKLKGMKRSEKIELGYALNEEVLLAEVDAVREVNPHAVLGVNILNAMGDFKRLVCALGDSKKVDVIYVGAGLPLDMSVIMEDYPEMRYVPIVSSGGAVGILEKRGDGERRPDGYVYEDRVAAGHNAKENPRRKVQTMTEHVAAMKGVANGKPIIVAGGIRNQEDIQEAVMPEEFGGMNANGIGLGTRGLLTQESGIDTAKMKKLHLNPDIDVERRNVFSPAGLPSTGKLNSEFYLEAETRRKEVLAKCNACLGDHCKFWETKGQSEEYPFCIATSLAEELKGGSYGVSFMGKVDENEMLYREENGDAYIPTMQEMADYVIRNKQRVLEIIK